MITEEWRLKIPGVLERVPTACDFVGAAAQHAGLDEHAAYHCQLAVDEACTNIIQHGYAEDGVYQTIDVVCIRQLDRFLIEVIDNSPAFNPLEHVDPDPSTPLEERKLGGWGIYFIKKVMDEVSYQYQANQNHLLMAKHLDSTSAAQRMKTANKVSAIALSQNIGVVLPQGRLRAGFNDDVEAATVSLLNAGCHWLVLDLRGVDYIASSGFKMLYRLCQRARQRNGNLALAALTERVAELVQMIGLDQNISVYPTAEEATTQTADWRY